MTKEVFLGMWAMLTIGLMAVTVGVLLGWLINERRGKLQHRDKALRAVRQLNGVSAAFCFTAALGDIFTHHYFLAAGMAIIFVANLTLFIKAYREIKERAKFGPSPALGFLKSKIKKSDGSNFAEAMGMPQEQAKKVLQYTRDLVEKNETLSATVIHIVNTEALSDLEKVMALVWVRGLEQDVRNKELMKVVFADLKKMIDGEMGSGGKDPGSLGL